MSWKFLERIFNILLEILSSPRELLLDRFWRQVSYTILVSGAASGGNEEEVLFVV